MSGMRTYFLLSVSILSSFSDEKSYALGLVAVLDAAVDTHGVVVFEGVERLDVEGKLLNVKSLDDGYSDVLAIGEVLER